MKVFRVIAVLLIKEGSLVKGRQFKSHKYVGDPINAIKILNDKGCNELVIFDIGARRNRGELEIDRLRQYMEEAFMPVAYGGGLDTVGQIRDVLAAGAEKVILNTAAHKNPSLVSEASRVFGSQSIAVACDYKRRMFTRRQEIFIENGKKATGLDVAQQCSRLVEMGAGEVILSSVEREGMGAGYDIDILKDISRDLVVPVVASNGAESLQDIEYLAEQTGVSGAAAGSMFVFQGVHRAVLISYPSDQEIRSVRRSPNDQ